MHGIHVLDVTDDGDCTFMVYGYMNRGTHEGKTGISLMKYNRSDNITEEMVFIPQNVTYEQLNSWIGEIEYLGDNNIFYFKLNSNMYAIDSESGEVMTEASNLVEGNYAVSDDKTMIAFATSGSGNEIQSIKIINIVERTSSVIEAPEGTFLKTVGFVENDLVYGVINITDLSDYPGYALMSRLEILNPDFTMARVYDEPGIYISEAATANMRVSMKRGTKNDNGTVTQVDDDQLINKNEDVKSSIKTEQTASDNRLKELYLVLNNKAASTESSVEVFKTIRFTDREIAVE